MADGIRLVSGALFNYNDPASTPVSIEDLATALSHNCRFAGHLPFHYSVAQHSLNASRIVSPEFAFAALMHDTAEAVTNDLPTPLKAALPSLKDLEVRIEASIAKVFGFQFPLPPAVKIADLQMLQLEKVHVKGDLSSWDILDGIESQHLLPLVDLTAHHPSEMREQFLARFYELRP